MFTKIQKIEYSPKQSNSSIKFEYHKKVYVLSLEPHDLMNVYVRKSNFAFILDNVEFRYALDSVYRCGVHLAKLRSNKLELRARCKFARKQLIYCEWIRNNPRIAVFSVDCAQNRNK